MAREVKKIVSITTQCYGVPYGRIENRFVGIISVELDGIRNLQWNAESVIFSDINFSACQWSVWVEKHT